MGGDAAAVLLVEDHLAEAHRLRCDLDALVLPDELERLLERQLLVGMSRTNSSAVDDRMLVTFFSLVGLTSMSSDRAFSPTIIPS